MKFTFISYVLSAFSLFLFLLRLDLPALQDGVHHARNYNMLVFKAGHVPFLTVLPHFDKCCLSMEPHTEVICHTRRNDQFQGLITVGFLQEQIERIDTDRKVLLQKKGNTYSRFFS